QGAEVDRAGQAPPAEDPQSQECRLEEEREQRLQGQGRAEDVADEARVFAPGHPELELLDQTGGHAHDEVDEEELAEEFRAPQIDLIAGAVIDRLDRKSTRLNSSHV